jgi:hypothetical protein
MPSNQGSEGEYYYSPNRPAKLKVPKEVKTPVLKGKPKTVGIYPHNDVLLPLGTELINVLEMRHRQLLTDVREDGYFGLMHYSQEMHKLGLVGTLARIKDRKVRAVDATGGFTRHSSHMYVRVSPFLSFLFAVAG